DSVQIVRQCDHSKGARPNVPRVDPASRGRGDSVSTSSIAVRRFLISAVTAVSLLPVCAPAAPPTIARIGVLMPAGSHGEAGLREGLSELGYIEGKNLSIESRPYAQSTDALQSAAADLVRSGVDVIVAVGTQAARAALSATST